MLDDLERANEIESIADVVLLFGGAVGKGQIRIASPSKLDDLARYIDARDAGTSGAAGGMAEVAASTTDLEQVEAAGISMSPQEGDPLAGQGRRGIVGTAPPVGVQVTGVPNAVVSSTREVGKIVKRADLVR